MPFPSRKTAIVGVYLTEQGNLPNRTGTSLEIEAFKGALNDAGLVPGDVDGIISPSTSLSWGRTSHMSWAEQLGQRPLSLWIEPVVTFTAIQFLAGRWFG